MPVLEYFLFGYNEEAMQKNFTNLDASKFHKCHNIITYYFVRSQIVRKYCFVAHMKLQFNISDIESKN